MLGRISESGKGSVMSLFSHRYGYKPVRTEMQVRSMDEALTSGLWNCLDLCYWRESEGKDRPEYFFRSENRDIARFVELLWLNYFKLPVDTIGGSWSSVQKQIRRYFFDCRWHEVYDFLEFAASNYPVDWRKHEFVLSCNAMLKREMAGYRFVGKKVTPITSEEEIVEIEQALGSKGSLQPMAIHLERALALVSDRKTPDYRNSIKESISAVEAISRLFTKKRKATLGDALEAITADERTKLHPALQHAFISLYGYASDAQGIRHSLMNEPSLDFEDAMFMLISCSAFTNYLKVKASKAGIDLEAT